MINIIIEVLKNASKNSYFCPFCPPWDAQGGHFALLPPPVHAPVEWKCPCMKKLKGEGNFPSYFDNGDVVLHIFAKFQIWNWLRRNIVVRKNLLFLYCYTKLSLSRRTGNQYLSSWNNLLNNFLSGLMFQYSFLLKSITCINYLIA